MIFDGDEKHIVVSDTTAIIALSGINSLDLLRHLYQTIYIPNAVAAELSRGPAPGAIAPNLEWIRVTAVRNIQVVAKLQGRLDAGEAEAIALALEREAEALIIDEKLGRAVATGLDLPIIGVMGVLLKAKDRNLIAKVRPYLVRLKNSDFRVSVKLVNETLARAGEEALSQSG